MGMSKCCKEIARCDRILDGKRGAIYAQQLTLLLDELKELGFFEKTQGDTVNQVKKGKKIEQDCVKG